MSYWRNKWPEESVTPKMHMLENHACDFIKKWGVGFGFYGEQGGESVHALFNQYYKTYQSLRPKTKRLTSIMEHHYLNLYPKIKELKPVSRKRGSYKKRKTDED